MMERNALSFLEAARIVELGLRLNVFDCRDVVAWADQRIAEDPAPPVWLLELATSKIPTPYELAKLIPTQGPTASPEVEGGVLLALMPGVDAVQPSELRGMAKFVYGLMKSVCGWDWTLSILCEADELDDMANEDPLMPGFLMASLRSGMKAYFNKYSLPDVARALNPIRCHILLNET